MSIAERIAIAFHLAYEELAPVYGYATREGPKPWDEVSEANRRVMEATVSVLIEAGVIQPGWQVTSERD